MHIVTKTRLPLHNTLEQWAGASRLEAHDAAFSLIVFGGRCADAGGCNGAGVHGDGEGGERRSDP
jgi:hypothetical protein